MNPLGDPSQPEGPAAAWSGLMNLLPCGILLADAEGRILEANPAAARILGLDRASLLALGLPALRSRDPEATPRLEWTEIPLPGGGALASFQDVTASLAQARHLDRMTTLYAALSQVNQAIVWSPTRERLLDKICEVMVEDGRFTLAWIGMDDPETHEVHIASIYGDRTGALEGLRVRSDDSELGRGGVGGTIREGRSCVINDFFASERLRPWFDRARAAGFAAMASFPIRKGGRVVGALVVYASVRNFFGPDELKLLEEAAGDVSFALDHLEMEGKRREAEERLRESEERYRTQFDMASEGIMALTPEGELVDVNEAFARMHGYTREEILGMKLEDLDSPDSYLQVGERMRRINAGEEPIFEVEHRHRNGHLIHLEVSAGLIQSGGKRIILNYHRDITERRRVEDSIRQAQKLESLGVLAGGIAHDFNNLLTAIMGNLNLAQAKVGEHSQARPYLEKVENTVLRAAELSRQMLAYSGKGHFVVKPRDLNAIIQEMTGLLAASLPKLIRLDLHLAPDLPLFKADGAQIQQVVLNLITNAAEAIGNREGGISITTYNADLDREVLTSGFPGQPMEAGRYLVLSVADTGCGIEPQVLSRIFDPFFTTKTTGRGLGLSAMLGILKGHKAGIHIETEVGQGTTFQVFFPALGADEAPEDQAPARRERHRAGTILLVDDEEMILESTSPALESLGFRVIKARDGVQALELFMERSTELALVLMDLSMPRMDGTSAFLAMRRIRPEVPVLLTSGYDQKEATEDLLAQGLAGFVQKPYRIRDLARELDRVLEGRG